MKYPVGPVTITPGAATLQMPASRETMAGLLLFNNSQYLLQVGPNSIWVQPFSSAWIGVDDCNPSNLSLSATLAGPAAAVAAGVAALQLLTGTWFSADEDTPDVEPFAADPLLVAAQIAAAGFPTTYQGSVVYDDFLPNMVPANAKPAVYTVPYDFSASASVAINIDTNGALGPAFVLLDWIDPTTGQAYASKVVQASGGGGTIAYTGPVQAPRLRITFSQGYNTLSDNPRLRVYRSNRPLLERFSGDPAYKVGTSNLPSGLNFLNQSATVTQFNSKGGRHCFRTLWHTAYDGTSKALIGHRAVLLDGTVQTAWWADGTFGVTVGTNNTIVGEVELPPGSLAILFQARAASTGAVALDLWSGTA